ncbi:hypothetical protein BRD18_00900 [Halobacteriales archaeon SW_7_71_33]|nr:MAG: hypothetical protein BRD18_00900 [Halobacteriales archaeon SW_7_71_33]
MPELIVMRVEHTTESIVFARMTLYTEVIFRRRRQITVHWCDLMNEGCATFILSDGMPAVADDLVLATDPRRLVGDIESDPERVADVQQFGDPPADLGGRLDRDWL